MIFKNIFCGEFSQFGDPKKICHNVLLLKEKTKLLEISFGENVAAFQLSF
jgi:hypothetical protein